MLELVDVGERRLDAYRGVAPDAILDELAQIGGRLRGLRILQVNATPYGGGVSELLRSGVPILNDLGLVADWKIIHGDEAFFQVTKKVHNALQGAKLELSAEEQAVFRANAERNAAACEEAYDVVFIHDPQPAAIPMLRGKSDARWIWRCHIDTSQPHQPVWQFVRDLVAVYDAAIFTMDEFVPADFPVGRRAIIPPAIDPLSPKNLALPEETARSVIEWIGVRLDQPLITQISRFDPWKDPLGVIAAYKLARQQIPGLQLALVGSMALDDPEGWDVYRQIREQADRDRCIHVFTNLTGVGNIEVNAFQRLSTVVVQKSIREGFGLVVSETLWKCTPVVAGRAGGIPMQMPEGVGGVLVDSVEDCARAIVELYENRDRAAELARRGQEHVRQHFLLPRLLLDELRLVEELLASRTRPAVVDRGDRDPVCGMSVVGQNVALSATFEGRTYRFCSEECRARFETNPERFVGRHTRDA